MRPPHRVAITGLGAVSALGPDVASLWSGAAAGHVGIGPIRTISTERIGVRLAGEAASFDHTTRFTQRQLAILDRASCLALAASREAIAAAGPLDLADPARAGVILGAAVGYETIDAGYKMFYGDNINRIPPLSIPRAMPNAAASHVSMEFGFKGPAFSTASACASANHAIGQAFEMIRSGRLDLALAGGSDASITPGTLKSWEGLRVLSADGCRPFSKDRMGLVIGEGAGILLLERFDRATARGATILGELVGFGMSADAGDITAPDPEGAAAAMRDAMRDAGLTPERIGYVNAHGTGTRLNDRAESAALRSVFEAHLERMPVSSTKSMIGHCLCAAGALELVVSVLALKHGIAPPTMGFRVPDPDCPIDCVPNEARAIDAEYALSNSFAFGGMNAVLVIGRVA